jgi:maleate isomerase
VAPQSIFEAAVAAGRGPVDGVFLSCTGLRTAGVIARAEAAIGKAVVSSNQALAWHMLRLAGSRRTAPDRGMLFSRQLAT